MVKQRTFITAQYSYPRGDDYTAIFKAVLSTAGEDRFTLQGGTSNFTGLVRSLIVKSRSEHFHCCHLSVVKPDVMRESGFG